jgi:hypothetical protein
MSDLDDLRALAPPPDDPPPAIDFDAVGTNLPPDYAELAQLYGAGTFDHGIAILVPGHPNRFLDLARQVEEQRSALRYLRDEGVELPYEPDELLPWGIDEGGNVLWWHADGDPAGWRVVANEARGDEWQSFDGGAVATLVALLSGREDSDFIVVQPGDTTFRRDA